MDPTKIFYPFPKINNLGLARGITDLVSFDFTRKTNKFNFHIIQANVNIKTLFTDTYAIRADQLSEITAPFFIVNNRMGYLIRNNETRKFLGNFLYETTSSRLIRIINVLVREICLCCDKVPAISPIYVYYEVVVKFYLFGEKNFNDFISTPYFLNERSGYYLALKKNIYDPLKLEICFHEDNVGIHSSIDKDLCGNYGKFIVTTK